MKKRDLIFLSLTLLGNLALADHKFSFTEFRQENRIETQRPQITKHLKQATCDNRRKDQECCPPESATSEEWKQYVEVNC